MTDQTHAVLTKPITVWPATEMATVRSSWPNMSTRSIVPTPAEGWQDYAVSEWSLTGAHWEDWHPHSETNLVIEGTLHVEVEGHQAVLNQGDAIQVHSGSLGKYWAPDHVRLFAVYGPNPDGAESTQFLYRTLPQTETNSTSHSAAETPTPENITNPFFTVWRATELKSDKPEWKNNVGRFITAFPWDGPWTGFIMSEWELKEAIWQDRHPHEEFNLVIEGELHLTCDDQTVILKAGDAATVAPGKLGVYTAPKFAKMVTVYGPNPSGAESIDFAYQDLPAK